ncbi:MAG TPA: TetR family transcriptional regulator [Acetobacteraceae bacterium]|nr:TetR family transcriptional regulator [Acetobacteraceae bacterium]HQU01219.1 TetR family transcriptional regulator [Acetobacteraceae bacterium]
MNLDDDFDKALVAAAFAMAGEQGWARVSPAAAARAGNIDLALARKRFSCRGQILARFGQLADAYALTGAMQDGTVKDRLFDVLMRRVDFLQTHRAGVMALGRFAPFHPELMKFLARANLRSMGWMLEGAGVSAQGLRGELRKRGLLAVWAWTMRAWARDENPDLSATMAALDSALTRADQAARQFGGRDEAETIMPTEEDVPFNPPAESEDQLL